MPAGQEEYNLVRVSQLKMPLSHTGEELFEKLRKKLRVEKGEILKYEIRKRSLDARKASEIHYTYAIDVTLRGEEAYLKKNRDRDITRSTTVEYIAPQPSGIPMPSRPVVCGSGPAGMFCAYFLARAGYKPIVIERGEEVGQRTATVERFFSGEALNTESNVQFGEGGAGTFSDGKLNTMVKDTYGRIRKVLEIFVKAGAPEEILYQNKPHIGTDNLRAVVAAMRGQIKEWGGEFHFNTKLSKIRCHKGKLVGISCVDTGKSVAPGEWEMEENEPEIEKAVAAARNVDIIIACIGENSYCETPGNLSELAISANQSKLVKALAATGKPIILILNEGRPRIINELEPLADAVIDILLPGNYGGDALANILAGDVNPSAKMPYTYPRHEAALTTYDYRVSEEMDKMEGAYDYNAVVSVQWPFGYGLSYTTFEYSNFQTDKSSFTAGDDLHFSIDVTNTGKYAGKEVVMLFSSDLVASLTPENRRLRAFKKVELQPGETQTVTLSIKGSDLAFVNSDGQWVLEQGDFRMQCGNQVVTITYK